MQPQHQHQRINLTELKAQMVKRLGPEGSKKYFYYLNRFLNLKLSKSEFNKLCIRIVGRENISLHNQFIHSILKNACGAKVPPLFRDKEGLKPVRANKEAPGDVHKQSVPNQLVLSNGDILPLSPRKFRTGTRDRKVLDRFRSLGPNGKINFVPQQSSTEQDSNSNAVLENGDLASCDIRRLVQHHQGLKEQPNNEGEVSHHLSTSLSLIKKLPDGSVSVHRKDPIETVASENRKEVSARSLLCAPIGVPCCPVSVGGARKTIPSSSSSKYSSSYDSASLLDTSTLRDRMEQIAATQGLEGVSTDSANLLNNGLDVYLKGLIASCIELVGARSGREPTKSGAHKHQAHLKRVNGVRLNHHHIQSNSRPLEGIQERKPYPTVSLQDFRVAMELNPHQLGEDWPLLLEKICTHAFEE